MPSADKKASKEEGEGPAQEEAVTSAKSEVVPSSSSPKSWGLREFTMFASFICAVDCTVFPILLTVLPAAEMLSPANLHTIHEVSEQLDGAGVQSE